MMKTIKSFLDTIIADDVLNALNSFPAGSIDLTITSPPYNKREKMRGWLVKKNGYAHSEDHMPEEDYQNWQIAVLNELFRVTKPGGSLFWSLD